MPDPTYKSETAAMNNKAKELRAKVATQAKKQNVSVPKSALDNFIDTYKKTKVGPIQRAIGRFIDGFNTKADYTSGKSTTAKLTAKAKSSRAKSQGGRSRTNVVEEKQKKLAAKSKASGGKAVLSKKAADSKRDKVDAMVISDTKIVLKKDKPKTKSSATVSDAQKKSQLGKPKTKAMATPKSRPKAPTKNKTVTSRSKPKMYTAINTRTGKPDFDAPKVTAAQRLKQEDKYKAFKKSQKKAQGNVMSALKKASKNKKGK
tara:strand:+ start:60 stop:839 length:780 start_codon:yes stop_codon:yes gene_type:complete